MAKNTAYLGKYLIYTWKKKVYSAVTGRVFYKCPLGQVS